MEKILREITRDKYCFKWGEKYSALILDMFARINLRKGDPGNPSQKNYISYVQNRKIAKAYFGKRALEEIKERLGKYYLKKNRIKSIINAHKKIVSEFEAFFRQVRRNNFKKASRGKLLKFFSDYVSLMEKSFLLFMMTRAEAETGPMKKAKQILQRHFPLNFEENYRILTESPDLSPILQKEISWLEIIKKPWNKKKIEKFILLFAVDFVNIYEKKNILESLRKKYFADQKKIIKIEEEIQNKIKQKADVGKKQFEIFKKCQSKELIFFSRMLQGLGIWRLKLKYYWAGAEMNCLPLFETICNLMRISYKDFFDCYLVRDVFDFLENDSLLSRESLGKRKKCILIRVKNGKYDFYEGHEWLKIAQIVESGTLGNSKILKGMPVCGGFSKNKVRIVYGSDARSLNKIKFKQDEILVSEGTQPWMVPLMKKASAILTEVGGITSHAAIIARELRKPCIVGINGLIFALKDGDAVEVDAEQGVVKILKKAR